MVDGFSCILDFPKFLYEVIPKTQNLSSTTTAANGKKKKKKKKKNELESPPTLKQSIRNLSLGYTEIEKRRRALGQD